MNQNNTTKRNMKIIKTAGTALAGQVLFYLIALIGVINIKVTSSFWVLIKAGFLIGLFLIFALLVFGFFLRKALFIHLVFVAIPITWVVALFAAGYEHGAHSVLSLSFIGTMCLMNVYISYTTTLQTLKKKDKPAVQSGRLDLSTGFWDLEKHLYNEENKSTKESLARLLLPLGSILGVLLYRNFPDQSSLVSIILSFTLATILVSGSGIHLATAVYVWSIQKTLKIDIYV